jgi:medium-chain acyl-[acyl-carrier-protein] hydrolase
LPFAGGRAALYRPWLTAFEGEVDVCPVELAGRGLRCGDRPARTMAAVVDDLLPVILAECDRPFALFGHSMGAFIAFALACAMQESQSGAPVALFLSAAAAPADLERRRLSTLEEDQFRDSLRRMGGIPDGVERHQALMDLMMPIVRADIAIIESWIPPADARLTVPIVAFGGASDVYVTAQALQGWGRLTTRSFRVESLPGGHFYLTGMAAALADRISSHLDTFTSKGELT